MNHLGWSRRLGAITLGAASIACAAVAWPSMAAAQTGKVSGVVTDASTGTPVEGAQVVVAGTGYGSLSQANGRYFIVGLPPGIYTITARRVGYAAQEVSGVEVAIDVTRDLNFRLSTSTILETQRIVAEATPLVERGITGSSTTITAEAIQQLPVTSIAGVLALQQGFVDVPQNTQLVALSEEQRSTIAPIRVRGGRGGATVTLVDGFPVNNPVFGTPAINLNPFAVSAVDFVRGYMEPQYGNGLSGIINQATREGGTEVAGSIDYQTTAIAGALGSEADELRGSHLFRGFLSGSVPGTDSRLRYAVSGQIQTGAHRVLNFDDEVFSFNNPQDFQGLPPDVLDLRAGWQAFGGTQNRQFVGKLTFLPSTNTKINLLGIDQERQTLPYDRRYLLVATGDPWRIADNIVDSLGLANQRNFQNILQSSVRDETQLLGAVLEQRFGRTFVQFRAARTEFERGTCNILLGACVPKPFTLPNFREQFIAPFGVEGIPFPGGAGVFGGEKYNSYVVRGDLQSQVSDHHNLQFGGSFLQHDIEYAEFRAQPGQSGVAASIPQLYRAKPIEFATYVQDRVEYDFLTVKLGFRFDYGQARGRGFRDPLNPTAGTTAREVCEGNAPSVGATSPYTFTDNAGTPNDPSDDVILTGAQACLSSTPNEQLTPFLLDSATRVAATDDFAEAKARRAFSPRIGVSFPLTERSAVFFNAGRYTMNPLYGNLYRNSGVGTVAGSEAQGGDGFCAATAVKPGTNECYPPLTLGNPEFIGNPNLLLEQATQYEVGYGAEFSNVFSINVAVYNRDETGLSGLVQSRPVQDLGLTYSGQGSPRYFTIVNQDFLTARGVEVQFRRRPQNFWSFDVNYGWSRATTNSPPPERSFEIAQAGELDRSKLREITADIDQTHRFNTTFGFRARDETPDFWGGQFLRNTAATITYSYSSGFPFSPIAAFSLGAVNNQANARDINAARAPATQQVNLLVQKDWRLGNVSYGAFMRVDNLLDRKNCVQVFVNTGTCDNGLRDPLNRRVGNFGETSSTSFDQPEYIGARRSISTGLQINF